MERTLENKNILLVISGGIAAYKSLELIRLIRKSGGTVRCILTSGGAQFITPLSVSSLSENETYTDLFSLKDETEMGHIRLSREADLIVVAPASANMIAKLSNGIADDLASTALLAANKQILLAPAMNHKMWNNAATQDNLEKLKSRGFKFVGPVEGDMACNEFGMGRMAEPEEILRSIFSFFFEQPLIGKTAIVTSGPTFEPIDPVRFIGNRSSGKQGHAIAQALLESGASVTLISGPVNEKPPAGVKLIEIETANEMLAAVEKSLPADIFIGAAAVSDWSPAPSAQKIKKQPGKPAPAINLRENPDILKTMANHQKRPALVVGFAAETENLLENAKSKLKSKDCDWIIANNVSENLFGSDENQVYLVTSTSTDEWKKQGKRAVAQKLAAKIGEHFTNVRKFKEAAE
ncbi:MAG: bifunctional phosphopantothenoylcysteine decarboxylase/phosphopantothenate--cysteine ligase CoaBC [Alphaproteobacteria bacterium]|nr:bifunctional phosphopantothenoylcysteine decarboxylase/phosphopantothenate--cysteine ligase CoaBC [Alphaproteobacteria bacterium]